MSVFNQSAITSITLVFAIAVNIMLVACLVCLIFKSKKKNEEDVVTEFDTNIEKNEEKQIENNEEVKTEEIESKENANEEVEVTTED